MEFLIGREVTGENTLLVPGEFSSVSRVHAKIIIDNGEILLQDLNSTNGTYVNGNPIVSKIVTVEDKITLGVETKYIVDLGEIVERYTTILNENKTDYSEEFDQRKIIYETYKKKSKKIRELRSLQSICIPFIGLIGVSKAYFSEEGILNAVSLIISCLSATIVIYVYLISKKFENKKHDFIAKYNCPNPKCDYIFPIHDENYSWLKLKKNKVCPKKCGAIYNK
ncbi:FHA domain-containing protein [Flavobacterium sp.]|uniref:FHA domain-containing protein n=1 Tax=Flavobacterium sp. TaxID=239 RepID=UPI003B9BE0B0